MVAFSEKADDFIPMRTFTDQVADRDETISRCVIDLDQQTLKLPHAAVNIADNDCACVRHVRESIRLSEGEKENRPVQLKTPRNAKAYEVVS